MKIYNIRLIKNILSITNIALVLLTLLILSSCSGDRCIDADDFGFSKFTVSSRYTAEELYSQQEDKQIAPWRDSGYTLNGRPLLMVVKTWVYGVEKNNEGQLSAWCPWYGEPGDDHKLSSFCSRLITCNFLNRNMCANIPDEKRIINAPCLLKDGVGLYGLIADKGSDPNSTFATQRSPAGIAMHLGEITNGYTLYDIGQDGSFRKAGGMAYKFEESGENTDAVKSKYVNSKLYFKILDKYYDDNNGQYKVVIKSGINDSRPDPIEFLSNLVKEMLFGKDGDNYGLVQNIYLNITSNSSYQIVVKALLTLYIVFSALSFLSGNLNITQAEFIARIVKVIIISFLLSSTYSWKFFHDYLYFYFVEGMAQILSIIQEAAQTGSGSGSVLGLMIAPQTIAKVLSLLFVDWLGFIYIILYIIALYFIFMMIFEATIIYLSALITIGMIIIMGPIFLCFMLFKATRLLFENWLKQLISYAMQPLILFTGLAFISIIIRTEIYSTLGFRVCKYDFPNLGGIAAIFGKIKEEMGVDDSITMSIFYWWFPSPMQASNFSKTKAIIPVPLDYFKPDGTFCEAYGCNEERYIELPFLDPVKDADRLTKFFSGHFVQLDGLFLIFIAVYLLSKFNSLSVAVSRYLSSSTGNLTGLQTSGESAFAPIAKQINRPIDAVSDKIEGVRERISTSAASMYEGYMMNSLRKDALGSGANQSVVDEVRRKYGMSATELKPDAIKTYEAALRKKVDDINKTIPDTDVSKKITEDKIRDLLTIDYKSLEKLYEGKFKGDLNLKELASNAKFAQDYQNYYAMAHQEMSGRGLGLVGKNSSIFRGFKEMDNRVKKRKEIEKQKRRQTAEALYSGYAGIKSVLSKAVVGKELFDKFNGSSFTGGDYGAIMLDDPRMRTYNEDLEDQQRGIKIQELNSQINRETIKTGVDILKPEYLLNLEKSGDKAKSNYYQGFAQAKISADVFNILSTHESTPLMGKKFMDETATDSQLKESIDKINQLRNKIIDEDKYVRREDKYEIAQEKAAQIIKENHQTLRERYGKDLSIAEMPSYLEQSGASQDGMRKLQSAIKEFNTASEILQKINDRKEEIDKEVNKYVDQVNGYRMKNNMEEYKPSQNKSRWSVKKLDDYF